MSWAKIKPLLAYIAFATVLMVSIFLYFRDQERQREQQCVTSRRELRGAIEWTVGYALGFDPDTDEDFNRQFIAGLHDGLVQEYPDEGCKDAA